MQNKIVVGVMAILAVSLNASAAQMCGKQRVADNVRSCPNGDIPMFIADEVRPASPPVRKQAPAPERAQQTAAADPSWAGDATRPDYYFGVWRTRIPGAVWTSPSGYQGYDWLHVRTGVSVGDLVIKPNGTYVWNSYGGKSGRWFRGDDASYPLVLIDTVENRQWKVGADPKRTGGRDIIVWDGNSFYYDGRK